MRENGSSFSFSFNSLLILSPQRLRTGLVSMSSAAMIPPALHHIFGSTLSGGEISGGSPYAGQFTGTICVDFVRLNFQHTKIWGKKERKKERK